MTNLLIDPVKTLRSMAGNPYLNSHLRDAATALCDEVESLRVEAYEAWRTDEDSLDLEHRHMEYRLVGVRGDGSTWESDYFHDDNGRRYARRLHEQLTDGRMDWQIEPVVQRRAVLESPWIDE